MCWWGNTYGYFRNELYLMDMSHHPAFGYVDMPPLVPWITLIPRFLSGNALWAIQVMSALLCAGAIALTGLMARLLGGTAWVQRLAALGSATALVFMANGSIYASTRSSHSLISARQSSSCSMFTKCPAASSTANVALG